MSGLEEQLAQLPGNLVSHLRLTLIALAAGLVISLPLGILATRRPRLEAMAIGVASVIQTIPGLALLALMVPALAWIGAGLAGRGWPAPPSIGFLPAVLALSLYSVLPMLRGTVTGIAGIDPALREAARGVGMTPGEILRQVELPLALPIIVAGIRTATVWVVGTATLATPVGAASLGNPIFAGLQTRNPTAVLVGSLAAAMLAVLLDGLVRFIERSIAARSRSRVWAAGVVFAAIVLVAIGGFGRNGAGPTDRVELLIGSKTFTEQYILAGILEQQLAGLAGVSTRQLPSLGSTVAFDALVAGDLDVYVDYSGTIWATILGRERVGASRAEVLQAVREGLEEPHGIEVAAVLGFENTYALAMAEDAAAARGITRISELVGPAAELSIAGDYEFFGRAEWRALQARYGLRFAAERAMDSSLMYEAIRAGSVDVISAYSTDGRIAAYDLRLLVDDLQVIPPYDAIVLVGARLRRDHPDAFARLAALEGALDGAGMRRLNARVDLEGLSAAGVARDWTEGWLRRKHDERPCVAGSGDPASCR